MCASLKCQGFRTQLKLLLVKFLPPVFFGDPKKSRKMPLIRKIGIKKMKFRCFNGPKPLIPVSPESIPLNEGRIEG